MTQLPTLVVTGALGAGKTSLITQVIARGLPDTAILVNEFAGLAIDQDIFELNGVPAVALSGGCICCSVRGDVRKALQALLFAQARGTSTPIQRVVIETSGMADPLALIEEFLADSVLLNRFRLAGVLTVVDATMPPQHFERNRPIGNQVAVADRIVLSKVDLPEADTTAVTEAIRRINGTAPLSKCQEILASNSKLFDPVGLQQNAMRSVRPHDHGPSDVRGLCIEDAPGSSADSLLAFIAELVEICGAALIRLKGIAQLESTSSALIVHVVRGRLYPAQQLKTSALIDRPRLIAIVASTHADAAVRCAKANGLALTG
ncbi:CobW family GTP-binding protein [Bradyrhizobium canariense]|uniref:GTPase, G3E family n=1 Tax=Bradyrhizobium canariense TaxID=255045 RepID=A0A1H1XPM2_9BRAD|nr:GTP-binding protein [Bradyrhizobium canariense]SDT11092.1 GTPase, G3E family [Bradyrhizobium canariense]